MIVRRKAIVRRKTKEVDITVEVDLDGEGCEVDTGIVFFNHMLETFAKHSGIRLRVYARGDDEHHLIEDVGIAMGEAIKRALGEKIGIERFGDAAVPMDDSIAFCAVDISGRGYLNFEGEIDENYVHFFESLSRSCGMNIYMSVKGSNSHHRVESCFKAFAMAFSKAIRVGGWRIRSTKGQLD